MLVLTGSEFRQNQAKYFNAARGGEDVVIKSRSGSFLIVPIKDSDAENSKENLSASLYRSLQEVKQAREGKGKLLSWEEFRNELER